MHAIILILAMGLPRPAFADDASDIEAAEQEAKRARAEAEQARQQEVDADEVIHDAVWKAKRSEDDLEEALQTRRPGAPLESLRPVLKDARARARRMAPDARLYGVSMKYGAWHVAFHEGRTFRQLEFIYREGKLETTELRQIRHPDEGWRVTDVQTNLIAYFFTDRVDNKEDVKKMLREGRWWRAGLPMIAGEAMRPFHRQPCGALGEGFMDAPKLQELVERRGGSLKDAGGGKDFRLLLFHPSPGKEGCMGLFENELLLPRLDGAPAAARGRDVWVVQTTNEELFFDAHDGKLLGKVLPPAGT